MSAGPIEGHLANGPRPRQPTRLKLLNGGAALELQTTRWSGSSASASRRAWKRDAAGEGGHPLLAGDGEASPFGGRLSIVRPQGGPGASLDVPNPWRTAPPGSA